MALLGWGVAVAGVALCAAGCTAPSPGTAADAGPSAPDVTGVEGHGGIAVVDPPAAAPPLAARPAPAPRAGDPGAPALAPGPAAGTEAKDAYLHGYLLKDSSPDEARALFRKAQELAGPDDALRQKAAAQLRALGEK